MKNDGWVGSKKMKKVVLHGDRGVGALKFTEKYAISSEIGWVGQFYSNATSFS